MTKIIKISSNGFLAVSNGWDNSDNFSNTGKRLKKKREIISTRGMIKKIPDTESIIPGT